MKIRYTAYFLLSFCTERLKTYLLCKQEKWDRSGRLMYPHALYGPFLFRLLYFRALRLCCFRNQEQMHNKQALSAHGRSLSAHRDKNRLYRLLQILCRKAFRYIFLWLSDIPFHRSYLHHRETTLPPYLF